MPETIQYFPEGAEQFRFPEEPKPQPKEDPEKQRETMLRNLVAELQDELISKLSGKTLKNGIKLLRNQDGTPGIDPHNKHAVWSTSIHGEQGGLTYVSDLAATPEGEQVIQNFLTEKNILAADIWKEVRARLDKIR